jgi:hypothetical protein
LTGLGAIAPFDLNLLAIATSQGSCAGERGRLDARQTPRSFEQLPMEI